MQFVAIDVETANADLASQFTESTNQKLLVRQPFHL